MSDVFFMKRALALAAKGRGKTSPNPMVGAVLVRNDQIIAEGRHRACGGPHAEVEALNNAVRKGEKTQGSILYVTLEPCCTHGKTPPCTQAIIKSGIQKVVYALDDPNPVHSGKAKTILIRTGIEVVTNVLSEDAAYLNRAFFHWIRTRTPWVILKSAMTLDGKIATASGHSKWITGEQARRFGMRLRHECDGILVGVNTIIADDPTLTVRGRGLLKSKPLMRIILDHQARTPIHCKVIQTAKDIPTLVVVSENADATKKKRLSGFADLLEAPLLNGKTDIQWLLGQLGGHFQLNSLLVEGGGSVLSSFMEVGAAQEVAFFYAPIVLGGLNSIKAVAGRGLDRIEDMPRLIRIKTKKLGDDWAMSALIQNANPS